MINSSINDEIKKAEPEEGSVCFGAAEREAKMDLAEIKRKMKDVRVSARADETKDNIPRVDWPDVDDASAREYKIPGKDTLQEAVDDEFAALSSSECDGPSHRESLYNVLAKTLYVQEHILEDIRIIRAMMERDRM